MKLTEVNNGYIVDIDEEIDVPPSVFGPPAVTPNFYVALTLEEALQIIREKLGVTSYAR